MRRFSVGPGDQRANTSCAPRPMGRVASISPVATGQAVAVAWRHGPASCSVRYCCLLLPALVALAEEVL
jgi:hypothetical protein